ncbi:hypothetical protein [Lysobacter sp. F6437]|uniref:hypothetical protein n=1 Tax=Lysobacter sp. F6437 TaxID=3459296 RepID=UPI00403E30D9
MAKLDIKTTVTAPTTINIPLVRADHAATSHTFRTCFEVALSIFSTLLGYVLGLQTTLQIHWVFLALMGAATLAFLILSVRAGRSSKVV